MCACLIARLLPLIRLFSRDVAHPWRWRSIFYRGGGDFFSVMYFCGDLGRSSIYVFYYDTTGGILSTRMMLCACDRGDHGFRRCFYKNDGRCPTRTMASKRGLPPGTLGHEGISTRGCSRVIHLPRSVRPRDAVGSRFTAWMKHL